MNIFLACFLAVVFASIAKDIAAHTFAQIWVARQLRRANIRRESATTAPMAMPSLPRIADGDIERQMVAFTELHFAALNAADKGPDQEAIGELLKAAGALRCALPEKTVEIIRTMRARAKGPVA